MPDLSAISDRASRHRCVPRKQRCLLVPDGMLRLHLRDRYANAVRAEGKVRRSLTLSSTGVEKPGQASSMMEEGLALAYERVAGSSEFTARPICRRTSGSPGGATSTGSRVRSRSLPSSEGTPLGRHSPEPRLAAWSSRARPARADGGVEITPLLSRARPRAGSPEALRYSPRGRGDVLRVHPMNVRMSRAISSVGRAPDF